jgi:sugar-specific transcriptional regulator TrmB
MEELKKLLQTIGLSEHESLVYTTGLQLGPTTVLKLSQISGVKRTTIYSIIESLKQRGLMCITIKGFKKEYVVESPEKISTLIDSFKNSFEQQLPSLMGAYSMGGRQSSIKYYDTPESIKNVYVDLVRDIQPGQDYLVISNLEKFLEQDRKFFQNFIEKRARLPIRIRVLHQDSPIAREHEKFQQNYNEEVRILPIETQLETNIVITPQRLVIQELREPMVAIVIENESIIKSHMQFFELLWGGIEK